MPTARSVLDADGEVLGMAGAVIVSGLNPLVGLVSPVGKTCPGIKRFGALTRPEYDLLMRIVGLTGGIGSGKSTVSARLADLGAVVIDADAVVKELQQPHMPVFDSMVERWGSSIVRDDGSLDRAAVAAIVFSDKTELNALEAIVHPVLQTEIKARIAAQADTDNLVVLDMALLAEKANPYGVSEIIVVDLSPEAQVDRLVRFRNFTPDDAEKRIAAQAHRDDRLALADHVIDNSGSVEQLYVQVDQLWEHLTSRP